MTRAFSLSYRPSLLLALLLLTNTLYDRWQHAVSTPAQDFFILWSVPRALTANPSIRLYTDEGERTMASMLRTEAASTEMSVKQRRATAAALPAPDSVLDAPGSPLLYSAVGLLSSGDYDTDEGRFIFLCLVCFTVAVVLLCRLLEFSGVSTVLVLILLTSAYAPLVSDVMVGNLNQIQLLGIALFVYFMARGRRFSAGVVLGVAAMLKPNIAMIALLALIVAAVDRSLKTQLRFLAGTATAALIAAAAASAYFGTPAIWSTFAAHLPLLLDLSYPLDRGNMGLSTLVFSVTQVRPSLLITATLLGLFTFIALLTRRQAAAHMSPDARHAGDLHDAFIVAGAGCAIMILTSNLAWLHYYVLLIPMSLYLIRPAQEEDGHAGSLFWKRVAAMGGLLLLSTTVGSLVQDNAAYSTVVNAAALVMTALMFMELWARRSARLPRHASLRQNLPRHRVA